MKDVIVTYNIFVNKYCMKFRNNNWGKTEYYNSGVSNLNMYPVANTTLRQEKFDNEVHLRKDTRNSERKYF